MDKFDNSQRRTRFQAEKTELEKRVLKIMRNTLTELKADWEMERL